MEYFMKKKIDIVKEDEYVQQFFTHQDIQKRFYKELSLSDEQMLADRELKVEITFKFKDIVEIRRRKEEVRRREQQRLLREAQDEERVRQEREDFFRMRSEHKRLKQEQERKERRKLQEEQRKEEVRLFQKERSYLRDRLFLGLESEKSNRSLSKRIGVRIIQRTLQECFEDSDILTEEQSKVLFLNATKDAQELPIQQLVGTYRGKNLPIASNLGEILTKYSNLLFIFKANSYVFGAYSDTVWKRNSKSGNQNNFIFNLTKDHKMYFNKRREEGIVYQFMDQNAIGFGRSDLLLTNTVNNYFF